MNINKVEPQTAKKWLEQNEAILIDVREPLEHNSQKINNSQLIPIDSINCDTLPKTDKKIIIYCQTGRRANDACNRLLIENNTIQVYNLDGGIKNWQRTGFPVEIQDKNILPLESQVQLTVGASVLIFSLLAYFVNPIFAIGSAFFGAGLINAGLTGWCGLAKIIIKMPWNK